MSRLRNSLVTAAAIAAAAVGGGAIANAATSSSTTPSTTSTPAPPTGAQAPQGGQPPMGGAPGRHTFNGKIEEPLSGDVAAKVRAAALAKVSGTVERVETNVDDSAPYEAHIRKADGSEVTVEINKDYSVYAVQAMGRH